MKYKATIALNYQQDPMIKVTDGGARVTLDIYTDSVDNLIKAVGKELIISDEE